MSRIELKQGDITKLNTDAIVNAANNDLLGGGGVDGAIHKAAGSELLAECRELNGCETSEAKITAGYNLAAKHVIHTVGPVWQGGENNEDELLANCYLNSLRLAIGHKLKSIAFPNISTGVYAFPKERACHIAVRTVVNFMKMNQGLELIIFVCHDVENYALYKQILKPNVN